MNVIIIGGGAAGVFAAITCAEANPDAKVLLLERSNRCLVKVQATGGGRCNFTNAISDPKLFSQNYPRGSKELIGPLNRFGSKETIAWFEEHGVKTKTEEDGRVFPMSDNSQTIIDCLLHIAKTAGVRVRLNTEVASVEAKVLGEGESSKTTFILKLLSGETVACDRLLIATGGLNDATAKALIEPLGHTVISLLPSLFSFETEDFRFRSLSGVVLNDCEASIVDLKKSLRGGLLFTHSGFSGPMILKLSAWNARELKDLNYQFTLQLNFSPKLPRVKLQEIFQRQRAHSGIRTVAKAPALSLPIRVWEQLVYSAGISPDLEWNQLSKMLEKSLLDAIYGTQIAIKGKSTNKEEFVTCGGVSLKEVNFKSMESKLVKSLFFAGECLDIDGITGGFNLQAAWTTGFIAGNGMAE